MRIKLAIRNLFRHKLRSSLSIAMIAGSISSMILFHGFAEHSLQVMTNIAAESQFGHMQIAARKFWDPGKEPRKQRMINSNLLEKFKMANNEIQNVSGRLSFFALASNGDQSLGAKIVGIDSKNETSFSKAMKIYSGIPLNEKSSQLNEVMIGLPLAKQMNVKTGDEITILTNTIDGVMNAMDVRIKSIYSTSIDEIDAMTIYAPLEFAKTILDTQDIDFAVVKFNKVSDAEKNWQQIDAHVKTIQPELKARTWRDLANLFRQVEKYYSVQNRLVDSILILLMFLGILNTISMTVIERTGEVGTLRALGENRSDIMKQFIIESTIVSLIGIVSGVIFSYIVTKIVLASHFMLELPNTSVPIQIQIIFLPVVILISSLLILLATLIATVIPSFRISRLDIVEALRKNI